MKVLGVSAVFHPVCWRLVGAARHRSATARPVATASLAVRAVLFDRDGTLIHDVPHNGDPGRVTPVDGAAEALHRLRAAGIAVGVVTNQSGVGRGLISAAEAEAVTGRVADLLGPFATVRTCPHAPADGCPCRKPRPGLVLDAARDLGVAPAECVVVGDIGSDVEAARAAGARGVLVPTPVTRPEEVATAAVVAPALADAVDLVLAGRLR
ncbi:MAG TPA: HAD-IIIA family hydrolase [Kineosporiaceae bacterium]